MRYEDHELLLLKDVSDEAYQSLPMITGAPIQQIPHPWAQGLDRSGLLGLTNLPHFGRLNEANACIKYLLVCFYGGRIWLNDPIPVMVDIIFDIMGLPKVDKDLAQYFRGWDNEKRIS